MTQENQKKPKISTNLTRRQFVQGAAAAAAFTIVPSHVLGANGQTPPSEKLNIAAIGSGGMGSGNLSRCSDENIVALCDVDDERAAETYKKYPDVPQYHDFRVMLEKEKSIEAVIVATPDHTHAVAALAAMQLGKHVYVQKPLTHSLNEARRLTQAAHEYGVTTQMGNQGHSGEGNRLVCEWIADGAIGPVREVHTWTNRPVWPQGIPRPTEKPGVPDSLKWDLWLGPAPERPYHPIYAPFSWRGWYDFGTGAIGDMGCHILDGVFWALKLQSPTRVDASSANVWRMSLGKQWGEFTRSDETYPVGSVVTLYFPARGDMPPVKVVWYDGGLKPPRPEELEPGREIGDGGGGSLFIGDKGKMIAGTYGGSPRIIPESAMRAYQRPPKTIKRVKDGMDGHEKDWILACKEGTLPSSNFDMAGPLTEACLLGSLAVRLNRPLDWDGVNMKITNDEEANQYVHRQNRPGWDFS